MGDDAARAGYLGVSIVMVIVMADVMVNYVGTIYPAIYPEQLLYIGAFSVLFPSNIFEVRLEVRHF